MIFQRKREKSWNKVESSKEDVETKLLELIEEESGNNGISIIRGGK